ncbi:MAG TPA: hypothetical protein VFG49_16195 [Dyella sp.]|uniref:hypothetical protein n=1 Tax=Dyella sp. TaxID=1869338 RepID=UPI002D78B074|nr:hypothetical protein [Dyella sp.]HET6555066.1 hypothetical protein [Dyella sp.]
MTPSRYRLAILALFAGGIALAGCNGQSNNRPATKAASTSTSAPASTGTGTGTTRSTTTSKPKSAATAKPLPENTGIQACDDYLASYVACHRAAAIYPQDQIEGRYETMRETLLRDSQDPNVRPELSARCNSLALSLRQALHGKSCAPVNPAPTSSTGASP